MTKLTIKQVQDRGRAIISASKTGVRWSDLIGKIAAEHPDTPVNSISAGLHALTTNESEGITKNKPWRLYFESERESRSGRR